jgi:hypothetical protein
MHEEIRTHLRMVRRIERRYWIADRDWRRAAEAACAMFPPSTRPAAMPIGDPGSPVRRRWEARERELLALMAAQARLRAAEARRAAAARRMVVLALPPAP